MRRLIAAVLMVSAASVAAAQESAWSTVSSCSVVSPETAGSPRLRLTSQTVDGKTFLSVHVITGEPVTAQPERFGGARIAIDPLGAEFRDLYGWTSSGPENVVGLGIATERTKFLDAVAAGHGMTIGLTVAGKDESFAIPLAGSAAAVAALRRCLQ